MKKVLSILSTLTLVSSAPLVLTGNINIHNQQTKNETQTGIDWNYIKNSNDDYFKNLKQDNKKQKIAYSSKYKQISSEEIIKYAQEKANSYIKIFKNQDLNSDQVKNILLNENSDFKTNYNNLLQEQITNDFQLENKLKLSVKNFETLGTIFDDYQKIQKEMPEIRRNATIFSSISIAAAVAATGFYAAAWFFGITLPWAIGCTAISVLSGIGSTYFNIVLYNYDQTESYLSRHIQELNIIYDLIGYLKNSLLSLKDLLMGEELAIVASEWAFTPSSILIPIIFYILSFVKF